MNNNRLDLLIVDEDAAHIEDVCRAFAAAAGTADIRVAHTLGDYREHISAKAPDVVLMDLSLPDGAALECLVCPPEDAPFPIVVVTGRGNERAAVEVMKAGALDYIVKSPQTVAALPQTVERVLREWRWLVDRRAAAQSQARLAVAVEHVAEAVMVTDAAGSIQYVNAAFERVSGYSADELLGRNPRILQSGEHDETFYRGMWQTLTRGHVWKGRMINKRKDGSLYTHDATISPVRDATGTTVSYVGVSFDVTEHLRMAAELQKAQKMESVGRLAGGVAHDFNNMLTVILGFAELGMADLDASHPIYSFLSEIHEAAKRSSKLTRQLLAFASKQPIMPVVVDLNTTVRGILKMLHQLVGEDIELQWEPSSDLWPVKVDPAQIDQVLASLCVNSRDAIAGPGRIRISLDNCVLDEAFCEGRARLTPGEYVAISVSDDGCGMDEETLQHVFEPFFTTRKLGRRTGLGLATVYGIGQQNAGTVDITSEVGRGTTVRMYLPRFEGAMVENAADIIVDDLPARSETILVVDDEVSILKSTCTILRSAGYQVHAASTPSEAIELAKVHGEDIDMLLTDVVMPEMTGRALATTLHGSHPHLAFLFMSGYTADVIARQGLLSDDIHFIQKPFTGNDLIAKVRQAMTSARSTAGIRALGRVAALAAPVPVGG